MTPVYEHRQMAWPMIALAGGVMGVVAVILIVAGLPMMGLAVAALEVVVLLLFGSLTVRVDHERLRLHFGIGLIRTAIDLRQVRGFRVVRNPWYYGWGIRLIPGGWLYNVSGTGAVELTRDDRITRVGSDEPEALARALASAGAPSGDEREAPAPASMPWYLVAGPLLFVAIGLAIALTLIVQGRQDPVVEVASDTVTVRAAGYSLSMPLAEMRAVTLEDRLPRVLRKSNGFSFQGTLRGRFRLEALGDGRLYVNRDSPPFVLIRTDDDYVFVNFAEPDRTRQLFETLRARAPRR